MNSLASTTLVSMSKDFIVSGHCRVADSVHNVCGVYGCEGWGEGFGQYGSALNLSVGFFRVRRAISCETKSWHPLSQCVREDLLRTPQGMESHISPVLQPTSQCQLIAEYPDHTPEERQNTRGHKHKSLNMVPGTRNVLNVKIMFITAIVSFLVFAVIVNLIN